MSLDVLRAHRPSLINLILLLLGVLTLNQLYNLAMSFKSFQQFDYPTAILLMYIAIYIFHGGMLLACVVGLLKEKNWSWWLAGVIAAGGVVSFIVALIQNYQINLSQSGQSIFEYSPMTLIRIIAQLAIGLALLVLVFKPEVKSHLGITTTNTIKPLGIMFVLCLVILILVTAFLPILTVSLS